MIQPKNSNGLRYRNILCHKSSRETFLQSWSTFVLLHNLTEDTVFLKIDSIFNKDLTVLIGPSCYKYIYISKESESTFILIKVHVIFSTFKQTADFALVHFPSQNEIHVSGEQKEQRQGF